MFDLGDSDELDAEQSSLISPQNIEPEMTFKACGGKYTKLQCLSLCD
jgi:hypothetical protein